MDNVVYPLTKLRRHDINYKVFSTLLRDIYPLKRPLFLSLIFCLSVFNFLKGLMGIVAKGNENGRELNVRLFRRGMR